MATITVTYLTHSSGHHYCYLSHSQQWPPLLLLISLTAVATITYLTHSSGHHYCYLSHSQQWPPLLLLISLTAVATITVTYLTHSSGHHYWCAACPEVMQSSLSISLRAVAMDTATLVTLHVEEIVQSITRFLGLHKDQSKGISAYNNNQAYIKYKVPLSHYYIVVLSFTIDMWRTLCTGHSPQL